MKYAIFDVDGVLLSEERCFDVSALVVWEWLNSPHWFGLGQEELPLEPSDEMLAEQRAYIWRNDEILSWMKSYNINSNWDMVHAYLVAVIAVVEEKRKSQISLAEVDSSTGENQGFATQAEVCHWASMIQGLTASPDEVFGWLQRAIPAETTQKNQFFIALRHAVEQVFEYPCAWVDLGSPFYTLHTDCFQEWYLGSTDKGKPGFLTREVPLAPPEKIANLFRLLIARGYTVCIGTGRGMTEVKIPFEALGWWDILEQTHIATADDAQMAEEEVPGEALDKPNPFTFRAAAWGTTRNRYADYVLRPEKFYQPTDKYYVIGDSPADVMAAKAMGHATMIATLTGLSGTQIRPFFEKEGVEYIISNILELEDMLQ